MKKNAMLKIAAVLLVAVLLTTCAISSTFAKYATFGGKIEDGARVAKWGVTASLSATGKGFSTSYGTTDNKKVQANEAVVAPGTNGSLTINYSVIGTPEVSFDVALRSNEEIADTNETNFLVVSSDALASQLVWTLKDGNGQAETKTVQQINDYLAGMGSGNHKAGEEMDVTKTIVITWAWEFEDDADPADTALGNDAANATAATISFNMYLDVVQTGAAGAASN